MIAKAASQPNLAIWLEIQPSTLVKYTNMKIPLPIQTVGNEDRALMRNVE